jgi:hypothetical protein
MCSCNKLILKVTFFSYILRLWQYIPPKLCSCKNQFVSLLSQSLKSIPVRFSLTLIFQNVVFAI